MVVALGQFFYIDSLSLVMLALISFVTVSVAIFAWRFLHGDSKRKAFYLKLAVLLVAAAVMVSADHILLLFITWLMSNFMLTRIMLHKSNWQAARYSAKLALKNFLIGMGCLAAAFVLLYLMTAQTSIQLILHSSIESLWSLVIAALLLLCAMTQSALWPFHRWLISSLNSPTPVSALMHAGLVNGGGFLLVRFAPIFMHQSLMLNSVFIVGLLTAMLGTLWKLMQSDIKRMLACSTMGQMGFMIAQCGLGLFPAAVTHLCFHGLFKAYLFLNSGSNLQEQRFDLAYPPQILYFLLALSCGLLGAYSFALLSGKSFIATDTTLFQVVLVTMTATQLALSIISSHVNYKLLLGLSVSLMLGACYGLSVRAMEWLFLPLSLAGPQPLNVNHVIALIVLTSSWLALLFGGRYGLSAKQPPRWLLHSYVRMLNASQPHPHTITSYRNQYQY